MKDRAEKNLRKSGNAEDGLGLLIFLFLVRGPFQATFDGILELANSLSQALSELWQLSWSKQDQNNEQYKNQMHWLEQTLHNTSSSPAHQMSAVQQSNLL
jgi:hypothetical protein